jgi:hypothetical protein
LKGKQSLIVPMMCVLCWALARSESRNSAAPISLEREAFKMRPPQAKVGDEILQRQSSKSASSADSSVQKISVSRMQIQEPGFQNTRPLKSNRTADLRPETGNYGPVPSSNFFSNYADQPATSFTEKTVFSAVSPLSQESFTSVKIFPQSVDADAKISGSFWNLARRGATPESLSENGQIGGAQAGVRLSYPVLQIGKRLRVSASSRLSFPLQQSNQVEGTFGAKFAIRGQVPFELIAERRFPIKNHGTGAWSLTASSGINATHISRKLQLDGYVQGGVVGIKSQRLFAGGNAVISISTNTKADGPIRLGLGAWGDAQPNAARLDLGPDLSMRTHLFGMPMRVSGQWRFRILGKAEPKSGPALVIGGDF